MMKRVTAAPLLLEPASISHCCGLELVVQTTSNYCGGGGGGGNLPPPSRSPEAEAPNETQNYFREKIQ